MSVKNVAAIGIPVIKAAQNLPQTATATLFTQSGGAVLVTGLLGVVTTALGATTTSLSVGTGISNTAIMTASAVAGKAAGTWIIPTASAGVGGAPVMVPGGAAFLTPSGDRLFTPFVLAPGSGITWTTNANDTGQIAWYLWYIPMDADSGLS
jgi:hypothetical protein